MSKVVVVPTVTSIATPENSARNLQPNTIQSPLSFPSSTSGNFKKGLSPAILQLYRTLVVNNEHYCFRHINRKGNIKKI